MNCELVEIHVLLFAGFPDESGGEFGAFAVSEKPADCVPAEDVKNHIQMIPGTLPRPGEQGDIPGPDLARAGGTQFWLVIMRMLQLIATLPHLLVVMQDAIHCSCGTVINALIQQCGVDLRGCPIDELF